MGASVALTLGRGAVKSQVPTEGVWEHQGVAWDQAWARKLPAEHLLCISGLP